MALVECPDCGKKVSDSAPACPGCGCPAGHTSTPREIEQTSKQYKSQQVIAVFVFFIGLLVLVFGGFNQGGVTIFATLAVAAGAILMIRAKFGAWWHNG